MKRLFSAALVLTFLFIGTVPAIADNASPDFHGGRISGALVLPGAGAIYTVSETVQIPAGSSLKIEPGARVILSTRDVAFLVAGQLQILGTSELPVRVKGQGSRFITATQPSCSAGSNCGSNSVSIVIEHALLEDVGETEYTAATTLSVSNSEVLGRSIFTSIWTKASTTITSSYFYANDPTAAGVGQSCTSHGFAFTYPQGPVKLESNTFAGNAGSGQCGSWIFYAQTQAGLQPAITGNAFVLGGKSTIVWARANLSLANNFISQAPGRAISDSVLDNTNNLELPGLVTITPLLSEWPAIAPKTSRLTSEKAAADKAAEDKAAADKAAADALAAQQAADAAAKAKADAAAKAVLSSSKTTTCVKGKLTKKVTGASPKCPMGYKKK